MWCLQCLCSHLLHATSLPPLTLLQTTPPLVIPLLLSLSRSLLTQRVAQALRDTKTWNLVNKWQHPSQILQKKDTNLIAGLCQMVTRWTSTPTPSTQTSPSTPVGKQSHTTSPPTSPMKKSVEIFLTFQAEALQTTMART